MMSDVDFELDHVLFVESLSFEEREVLRCRRF